MRSGESYACHTARNVIVLSVPALQPTAGIVIAFVRMYRTSEKHETPAAIHSANPTKPNLAGQNGPVQDPAERLGRERDVVPTHGMHACFTPWILIENNSLFDPDRYPLQPSHAQEAYLHHRAPRARLPAARAISSVATAVVGVVGVVGYLASSRCESGSSGRACRLEEKRNKASDTKLTANTRVITTVSHYRCVLFWQSFLRSHLKLCGRSPRTHGCPPAVPLQRT